MHGCKVAAAQDSQEGEGPGTLVLLFARTARCTVTTYGVYYYVVRVHIGLEGEGPGTLVLLFARTARCTVTTYGVYYYVVRVHIGLV
jgi:plastocyanin